MRWPLALALLSACSRPVEPKPVHTTRVVSVAGDVEPKLVAEGKLADRQLVTLAKGARLVVSLDDGTRVEARGPAQLAIAKARAVWLRAGLVSVDVAAQAAKTGHVPFSLATPALQLEVPFAARLVVRENALAVISGEVALSRADGVSSFGTGARVCIGPTAPEVQREPGFSTVEAALAELHACERAGPARSDLQRELAQRLATFATTKAEERELLAKESDPERLRTALASRAQRSLNTRTRALALAAQLEASQLGAADDPALARLLERAHELENPAR